MEWWQMESSVVSGKTRVCGIIGDPIEHTMSPVMHNAAFQELGIDYVYIPLRVRQEDVGNAVASMKALNIRGLNVTIPHKMAVIPFLDRLDPLAETIGAVNTIVNEDGILTGYNTDATGFLQALLEKEVEPKGKNIIVLGAGGAAKGISFILAERGASLVILNRHLTRARDLTHRISQVFKNQVKALALNEENLSKVLDRADVLINTTSVGMIPDMDITPVPARLLKPGLIVFDIVYNPLKTRLLKESEAIGGKTISGIEMLVWQGALAFEKWTGRKAPINLMREEAVEALRHED